MGHQAPLSVGFFSRQEKWSGLPFPSPEDLPDPGIKPMSPAGKLFTTEPPRNPQNVAERSIYIYEKMLLSFEYIVFRK